MIYYTPKGKIAGEMRNGIYVKRVRRADHYMKIFEGYGISKSILEKLKQDGCTEIRISEDGDTLYRIAYKDFIANGIEKNFDDLQVFCPLKLFESKDLHQQTFM